ncbi:MAG TPA: hypothetical protein VIQ31_33900 [Phormidium sp.]
MSGQGNLNRVWKPPTNLPGTTPTQPSPDWDIKPSPQDYKDLQNYGEKVLWPVVTPPSVPGGMFQQQDCIITLMYSWHEFMPDQTNPTAAQVFSDDIYLLGFDQKDEPAANAIPTVTFPLFGNMTQLLGDGSILPSKKGGWWFGYSKDPRKWVPSEERFKSCNWWCYFVPANVFKNA